MNFVGFIPKGRSGISGFLGTSGVSGYSGRSGYSGYSGLDSAGGPALVQQAVSTAAGGTPSASISPTLGNSIIAEISYLSTDSLSVNPKLTGGTDENLTLAKAQTVAGVITEIWYLHNIGASHTACTFTVTLGTRASIQVQEFSGLFNSAPTATNSNSGVAGSSVTTGSVAPIMPNNLVVASGAWTADNYSTGPINSWTRLTPTGGGAAYQEAAYLIQSAATSASTGWGLTAPINWTATVVSFAGSDQSSVLVAGAGTAAANGTYTYRGLHFDGDSGLTKPYYNLVGQPTSNGSFCIQWEGSQWLMTDGTPQYVYESFDAVEFPWLAIWSVLVGDPAPTVTEG